jgi:hypothetical protein
MLPIRKAHGVTDWQHHPHTDAGVLKCKFDFPCLNLPAGYFCVHNDEEYVLLTAVRELAFEARRAMKRRNLPNQWELYLGVDYTCKAVWEQGHCSPRESFDFHRKTMNDKQLDKPFGIECALSSVEEHYLHTVGVAGSSPAARTIPPPRVS